MKNWTVNARIAITVAFLGVLLIAIGALGIFGMSESNDAQEEAYSVHFASMVALGKSGTAMSRARFGLDWAMGNLHSPQLNAQLDRAKMLLGESDKWWDTFRKLPKTPELQRLTEDLDAKRTAVLRDGIGQLIQAIRTGDTTWMDESRANHLIGLYSAMNASQGALEQYLNDQASEASASSQRLFDRLVWACVISVAIGLIIAFVSWRALRSAIMTPLNQALGHFDAIASGELTRQITVSADDEMGTLLKGLGSMQDRLRATVTSVRTGSDSIAMSTQEIAAGNLDLSQRTEEQAASLEETASAMEQLTATVQANADHARSASRIADEASALAGSGRAAVEHMVSTMRTIHSGSSKMTDIVSVIEGLAFQTNLLALNAAVEAARAGEGGRGFAVVAAEVRGLAQRSAAAAKEIGTLIASSTTLIEGGAEHVERVDTTMRELDGSIKRVATFVSEIASASEEQSDGLSQVNLAVTQMDEVTQQNAALVEQSAATASSLADQATKLQRLTEAFQV